MRLFLVTLLFVLIPGWCLSQEVVTGRVVDSGTNEPLAFVHMVPEGTRQGATTDIDGRFRLSVPQLPITLLFSYVGYAPLKVTIDGTAPVVVRLERSTVELRTVDITPTENPAHRIIKKVHANRKINDGLRNRAHRYKSYSKTIFTADVDSAVRADPAKLAALDTSDQEAIAWLEEQYIMLIESVTAKRFIPPDAEQEEVLAMRVSGLKDPSLMAMVASTQTFSVYEPVIRLNELSYLSPISANSTDQYLFIIQDTLYQNTDSVFVITYKPRSGKNFDGVKGVLWVNTDGYAIQNVIAEPMEREGGASLKLQQQFERVFSNGTSSWFPVQLNVFVYFDLLSINSFKMVAVGRSYLKEIELDADVERKEVRGPDLLMEPIASKRDEEFWNGYREQPLEAKELRTYEVIDSISDAENLETKLKWLERLVTGRAPIGPVDLLLDKVMRFNGYEGFRLGAGLATNDRISRYVSLGGYFGYGFKDRTWKYGGDLTFKPRPERDIALRLSYANDVDESGGIAFPGKRNDTRTFTSEAYRWLFVDRMDRMERFAVDLEYRLSSSFKVWIGTERTERVNVIGYEYVRQAADGVSVLENSSMVGAVSAGFRFAYKERIIRLPGREFNLGTRWPILKVNFFQGFKGLWDGSLDTWRVTAQLDKTFRFSRFGDLSFRALGGIADPSAPYAFLFNPRGTFSRRAPIATQSTFETMRPNEFLADTYGSLHVRHSFGNLLYKGKKFRPVPIVVASAGWGSLSQPENHRGYDFIVLDQGYYEGGLQIDQLLKTGLLGLGVGTFYRFGPYALAETIDNFAFKLSLSLAL